MQEALDGELLALRERLRTDTPYWAGGLGEGGVQTAFDGCCTILNERKQPVRLKARPWQARTPDTPSHVTPLDEALESQRLAGQPMRVRILKARKLGFSTWVQAKFMQRVSQRPYRYALTIAHLEDSYAALAAMARLMYDRLPTDYEMAELILGPGHKAAPFSIRPQMISDPSSRGNRRMEMGAKARPSEASIYATMTAGSKGGGRALTPSELHLSEVAHYEDEDFLVGILNAVPSIEDTIIVEETTANGFNHFHTAWEIAVDGQADPNSGVRYIPLFYGWHDNPFNAMAFLSDDGRASFERTLGDPDGGGDREELELLDAFPWVTFEQLLWRRSKIAEMRGNLEKFHQEHPATPEQAFIGSGQPVFPGILVAKMIREADEAPASVTGVLRATEHETRQLRSGTLEIPTRVIWVPDGDVNEVDRSLWGDSRLRVWEHPRLGLEAAKQAYAEELIGEEGLEAEVELEEREPGPGQYVIFGDVSTGQGNTFTPGDWHAIQVLDHVRKVQMAVYRSRIPLADLPLIFHMLAVYFNDALVAPEVNGPGVAVVDELKKFRTRLYRRRRAGDDQRSSQREFLLGWMTDMRTKPLMEMTFGEMLRDGIHGVRDVRTAREFTTYVEDEKNPAKHGAQPGAHDDLVISWMGVQRVGAEIKPQLPGERSGRVRGRRQNRDSITDY